MSQTRFESLIRNITGEIGNRPLDQDLQSDLNTRFPPGSEAFDALADSCREGIAEGWLCASEHGGIRYGRVIRPGDATLGFSVDVVLMEDVAGPHHRHPNGEIDMIIPETEGAEFDGHGAGWLVCEADSAHYPTVSNGRAIVLYLLPDGAIEFTR